MIAAVIVAGGRSSRMGKGVDKLFLKLGKAPIIAHTLMKFQNCQAVKHINLVVRADARGDFQAVIRDYRISKVRQVVVGGAERQNSVWNGLQALPKGVDIVLIHDGARPCVSDALINQTIQSVREFGSGIAACKLADTIKEVDEEGRILSTVPRDRLWAVQTPQAFRYDLIMRAYRAVIERGARVTDDASAVELLGEPVHIVESPPTNIKVTTPADLSIAGVLLPAELIVQSATVPTGTFYFGRDIEKDFR
ncbi:MAG: 2-C-methyl-D-erythritol 4-phosphate cytidylyltransferase [Verrucomicrobia bacterium]|nr:2-C-methyl-D-erythritol 4-phosphate cytidylyltransferase [Verrucomicrobiota bacterium]